MKILDKLLGRQPSSAPRRAIGSSLPKAPFVNHVNPKRNAERKLVKAIGIRQAKRQRYARRDAIAAGVPHG